MKATFKGRVTLTDLDPPNAYRISGEGQGGVAGFAKGGASVRLADAEAGGTLMAYDVEATSAASSPSSAAASSTASPRNTPTSSSPISPRCWRGRT